MSFEGPISVCVESLDLVMPMHLLIDENARICHAGPTISKILGIDATDRFFFSLFEMRRPRYVTSMQHVRSHEGYKGYMRLRDKYQTPMIGTVTVLRSHELVLLNLLNLSFGYSVVDAVGRYNLAGSDFAATDLTVEMLYLVEAKSAALEASTEQAHRLHDEKEEAQVEALTDGLTGLFNRRALDERMDKHLDRHEPFSLMLIDLDFFKAVNDTLGHAAGDTVLREVARILKEQTRDADTVARVGGDEFAILFSGLVDTKRLESVAERTISELEKPVAYKDEVCKISASIGIVLYISKDKGRACATLFTRQMQASEASES